MEIIVRKACATGLAVLFAFGILLLRPMISEAQAASGQEVFWLDPGLPASVQKKLASVEATKIRFSGEGPKVLIYHTHTEAYAYAPGLGDTCSDWRTDDAQKNIIAVGEALAGYLEEYGIEVLHDQTNHEPPKLATAYTRSLIKVKDGRYNQQVGRCLLVNIGNNRNTLAEARNAAQCLAKAIAESVQKDSIAR